MRVYVGIKASPSRSWESVSAATGGKQFPAPQGLQQKNEDVKGYVISPAPFCAILCQVNRKHILVFILHGNFPWQGLNFFELLDTELEVVAENKCLLFYSLCEGWHIMFSL